MAASNTTVHSARVFHNLQSIHFYMERHRVEHHKIITRTTKCQTKDAAILRIRNIVQKSKQDKLYYLGSTYTGDQEHLWFYMRILLKKGEGSILNIHVIHKKVEELDICMTFRDTVSRSFESPLPGENYHIKTIKLSEDDMNILGDKPLFIPIAIETSYPNEEQKHARIRDIIERCKRQLDEKDRRSQRIITDGRGGRPETVEPNTE